jgi:hypothetical protein
MVKSEIENEGFAIEKWMLGVRLDTIKLTAATALVKCGDESIIVLHSFHHQLLLPSHNAICPSRVSRGTKSKSNEVSNSYELFKYYIKARTCFAFSRRGMKMKIHLKTPDEALLNNKHPTHIGHRIAILAIASSCQ